MKSFKFISIAFLLTVMLNNSWAQAPKMPMDETKTKFLYSDVIQTPGLPADLFNRCIENFINKFYVNPTEATSTRDKESGQIICKHRFKIYNVDKDGKLDMTKASNIINYVLTINFKDGRYKFTLTDFNVKAASALPLEKWINDPLHDAHLKQIDEFAKDLIKQLKKAMLQPAAVKKEEW
ncbi:MAG: DUF4468 domain-containing protein [Bacteroidota bacterium]